ncbi:MAG: Do family serine endopeptidase [Tannerella sp.]|nr:Do family serine endopeptidase [Tannerella sp.]
MKTFWKKVLTVVIVAVIGFVSSVGAVAYLIKNNKDVRAVLVDDRPVFKQPVSLANYAPEMTEGVDFTYSAEQAIHAVVHIRAVQRAQASRRGSSQEFDFFDYFFGDRGGQQPRQQQPRQGYGSGVIISTDGYIITNNHVIERAQEIEVSLNDNRTFTAKVIGADPNTDIALLKIEATDLHTLPFGDSEMLKIGEWVLAVGNPFNLKSTVTAGIVSAKGRAVMTGDSDREKIASYIQTDAAVNPGNSGGALVNTKGELIGINTALYSQTGNFAGYSFAVPISIAGKIVADLKEFGVVQRGVLGISMISPQRAKQGYEEINGKVAPDEKVKVLEGAYIAEFMQRSSAKEAGMQVGDVITAVNGVSVKSTNAVQEQIAKFRPGNKVKIDVDRYGTAKSFTVELRNIQGNTDVVAVEKNKDGAQILGVELRVLSDEQKREFGISYGIEVTETAREGKIRDAGIRRGFIIMTVNNERVSTPDNFYEQVNQILNGASEDKWLLIRGFYQNGQTQRYAIDLAD